jgi:hypothetical protein
MHLSLFEDALARLQSQSDPRTTRVQAHAREEAFDQLLDDLRTGRIPPESQTIQSRYHHLRVNRTTKHCWRQRLLCDWWCRRRSSAASLPPEMIDIRECLARARGLVSEEDWQCLWELAQGDSYKEVAARHGLNLGNLKTRVSRARTRIREQITRSQ